MKKPKFEVFQDAVGNWVWHLKSANGRIIAHGESHGRRDDAVRAVYTVRSTLFEDCPDIFFTGNSGDL